MSKCYHTDGRNEGKTSLNNKLLLLGAEVIVKPGLPVVVPDACSFNKSMWY